jgi:acetyl esterase/lipase
MKRFIRLFLAVTACIYLLAGCLHFVRVRSTRGLVFRSLKSLSEAASPLIAVAAGLTALASLAVQSSITALAAGTGALLSIRYILSSTSRGADFSTQFGRGWKEAIEQKISPQQRQGMQRHRWSFFMRAPCRQPGIEKNLSYGPEGGISLEDRQFTLFDLWQPPVDVPATGLALIYVHGGGYFTSQKDFGTRGMFRHLAVQGHTIMDINYRLAPQAGIREMVSDVKHAVAWMKKNASRIGVNPKKIVLCGASAGAHLAMLCAYAPNDPHLTPEDLRETDLSVAGVVSYYGVVDLAEMHHQVKRLTRGIPRAIYVPGTGAPYPFYSQVVRFSAWVRDVDPDDMRTYIIQNQQLLVNGPGLAFDRLLGGPPEELPGEYQAVSAAFWAGSHCPPTLLFQGTHDYLLPLAPAQDLERRLIDAGVPCFLVELPQTEHTFDLFLPRISPPAQAALYDFERFLAILQ